MTWKWNKKDADLRQLNSKQTKIFSPREEVPLEPEEHLDLSGNFFTRRIPESLGNCLGLKSLLLYMNTWEETIPLEFGNLGKLEVLDVSRNTLSGPLPAELGNCSSLSVLVLSNLYNVYEDIHSVRGESDLPPGADLTSMTEDFNFYQGGIPEEITRLPKLKILWVPIESYFRREVSGRLGLMSKLGDG